MKRLALLALITLSACAGLSSHRPQPPPGVHGSLPPESAECLDLESGYRLWGGLAVLFGSTAGAAGLAELVPDDQTGRRVLAGVSIGGAALSATAIFLRDSVTAQYGLLCEPGTKTSTTAR